jgi:hypothetical protein
VRDIGKSVAVGDSKKSCRSLGDLSKKITELADQGKLSGPQAATLGDEVAHISGELGC